MVWDVGMFKMFDSSNSRSFFFRSFCIKESVKLSREFASSPQGDLLGVISQSKDASFWLLVHENVLFKASRHFLRFEYEAEAFNPQERCYVSKIIAQFPPHQDFHFAISCNSFSKWKRTQTKANFYIKKMENDSLDLKFFFPFRFDEECLKECDDELSIHSPYWSQNEEFEFSSCTTGRSCPVVRRSHVQGSRLPSWEFRRHAVAVSVRGTKHASASLSSRVPAPTPKPSSSRWHPVTKAYLAKEIPESDKKNEKKLCKHAMYASKTNFHEGKSFLASSTLFRVRERARKKGDKSTMTNDDFKDVETVWSTLLWREYFMNFPLLPCLGQAVHVVPSPNPSDGNDEFIIASRNEVSRKALEKKIFTQKLSELFLPKRRKNRRELNYEKSKSSRRNWIINKFFVLRHELWFRDGKKAEADRYQFVFYVRAYGLIRVVINAVIYVNTDVEQPGSS